MTKRTRFAVFAVVALALSFVVCVAVLLAADLYVHRKVERSAGLNRWGYRGPVVGRKQPGESRVVMLGGSTAFGYGVGWSEAIPALLEADLRAARPNRPVSVVNLGYNNEGAYSFRFTLDDFAYLRYDIVILYEGYNDLIGEDPQPNTAVFRHSSPIFRATGYFPILPLALHEKAMALRYGGDLASAYRGDKRVFQPNIVQRSAASAIEAVAAATDAVNHVEQRHPPASIPVSQRAPVDGCAYPWRQYCAGIGSASEDALARGAAVIVVTQPFHPQDRALHQSQQRSMSTMLERRFGRRPAVRYVNLGDAIDLHDRDLCWDAMHLTARGNARIAALLAPIVADTIDARGNGGR